jgi:hypothetical protein
VAGSAPGTGAATGTMGGEATESCLEVCWAIAAAAPALAAAAAAEFRLLAELMLGSGYSEGLYSCGTYLSLAPLGRE